MLELTPIKLKVTPEEEDFLSLFAEITNGYELKTFNLEDIFCEGEILGEEPLNGQTGFFRHARVFNYLLDVLKKEFGENKNIRILAAPSSIGCELYGLSALALSRGFNKLSLHGFDCSETFTSIAKQGRYPRVLADRLWDRDRRLLFDDYEKEDGVLKVKKQVFDQVTVLPVGAFQDFEMEENYDVVIMNNLFQYLDVDEVESLLNRISKSNPAIIIFTLNGVSGIPCSLNENYFDLDGLPVGEGIHPKSPDMRNVICQTYGFWFNKDQFTP